MNRVFRRLLYIFAVFILAISFLGCTQNLLDEENDAKAYVSIGSVSRSIAPVFGIEDLTDLKLYALKESSSSKKEIASWATYAEAVATDEKVEVEKGKFNFELTAKKGGLFFSGVMENVTVGVGNTPLSFELELSEVTGNGKVEISLSFPKKMIGKAEARLYTDKECAKEIANSAKTITPEETKLTYSVENVPAGICYAKFTFYSDLDGTVQCDKNYISDSIFVGGDLETKTSTPIEFDKSFLKSDPWVLVTIYGQEKPFVYKMPAPFFTKNVSSDICSSLAAEGITGISKSDFTTIEFHNLEGVGKQGCDSWDKLSAVSVCSCFDTFAIEAEAFNESGKDDGTGKPTALKFESNVDVAVGLKAFENSTLTEFPFEHVVTIGSSSFTNTKLKEVDISDSIITYLESSFQNCLELETVKLPSKIKAVSKAFIGCSKLSSVYINTCEITGAENQFDNPFDNPADSSFSQSLVIYIPKGKTAYFRNLGGFWEYYNLVEDIDYSAAKVGDIILTDGTLRKPDDFVAGTDTPAAIVVRAKSDAGPVLGMGVQFGTDMQWCIETAAGFRPEITSLAGTEASGFTNGSSGLAKLKEFVSDWSTVGNYPAWEYCANYGSNNSLTENMATGWYLPAFVELVDIYWEKDIINATLEKLNIGTIGKGDDYGEFWSCNQVADGDTPSWYAYVLDMGIYDEEVIVALPDYFKISQCNVLALHAF